MFNELYEIVTDFLKRLLTSRLFAMSVIFTLMFAGLAVKLFHMQILEGAQYQSEYMQRTEQTVITPGTRGNIYDRNGNVLAYNELAYTVTIRDVGAYSRDEERNAMLYRLVRILEKHGETVEGRFEVAMDESGEMYFTFTGQATKNRFMLNFYGLSSTSQLDDEEGRYPTDITAYEAFEEKKEEYGLDEMKDEKGNALILPDRTALNMVNIIFTMKLTEYQKYEATTVSEGIAEETMAEINENIADLQGVEVGQSSVRVYNDSLYFAPIIGYTGKIQEDQLEELNNQWRQSEEGISLPQDSEDKYNLNDVVGRTGIEQSMELELQGEKGYTRMYVDNMGRPREIIEQKEPTAGDDIYLTIDRDLQIGIYRLIEQQLAGILVDKLRLEVDPEENAKLAASKKLIPVKDAYYQLINNNVLSLDDMAAEDAESIEREIYSIYQSSRERILENIRSQLTSAHPQAMNDLSEEMRDYMNYIYSFLAGEAGVVKRDQIDTDSESYQAWAGGSISLREYIYSGIAASWVDTTKLEITSRYSDADDIFQQLVDFVIASLEEDDDFTKEMFRYLINDGYVTGRQLCLALFAQGVLAEDPQAQAELAAGGEEYAFNFIRSKISNIEITPAQLALDPCTAGVVVTDVNTGEVLALVTYPSYDNNQMSGSVDPEYFAKLQSDLSNPLYNNATQASKAPGSTFKPITAIAALEEGVVNTIETIDCTGIYENIDLPLRCWIYPGRHNAETLVEGIQNSCNYVMAELAHRLSTTADGTYSPDQGLETLSKYATMFGLDHTSGVELPEVAPHISDTDPERSSIGQGTNSFANVQLARYVAAVANRGTVFELSLLDKRTDSDGNLLEDYNPEVHSQLDITEETWNTVHEGMRRVITNSSTQRIFSDLPVSVAGKTGTAEENKNRGNHAFFVSFAPYESPEIAVTVNIPYGYTSANAATLGKRVYEYYYGYTTLDEIMGSGALGVNDVTINGE